jgi:hypothetical protein
MNFRGFEFNFTIFIIIKGARGPFYYYELAEREGFEPPDPCGSTVFKTAALNRSATSPVFNSTRYATI